MVLRPRRAAGAHAGTRSGYVGRHHMTRLLVWVTPRASADRIDGFDAEGRLRMRVTAPPADGAANAAVAKLLAKALGLPSRDVMLVSGAASRLKLFQVPIDEPAVRSRLAAAQSPTGNREAEI